MTPQTDPVDPQNVTDVNARIRSWARPDEPIRPVAIERVIVEHDGIAALASLVDAWSKRGNVLMVADRIPKQRGGSDLNELIMDALPGERRGVSIWHLPNDAEGPFHPTVEAAHRLAAGLPMCAVVISVGSGSVTDTAKYARHLVASAAGHTGSVHTPRFISFPTAASVTAYTSALAVLSVDGVKRTLASMAPDAVVCDLPTLRDAPRPMTLAGFGDVMARSVAYGDWVIANMLGMDEGFSEVPGRLLEHSEAVMINAADAVAAGETAGVRRVIDALLLAGMAMSIVNQTAPVSGWEHVLSHFLDLTAAHDGRELALHGAQVGAGTLIAARAYASMQTQLDPSRLLHDIEARAYRAKVHEAFSAYDPSGAMVAELWRDLEKKLNRWNNTSAARRRFVDAWRTGEIEEVIRARVRPVHEIDVALRRAGCVRRFIDLAPAIPPATALSAVRFAHLVRSRMTLGDLLDQAGWLTEERAGALLEGSDAAGG